MFYSTQYRPPEPLLSCCSCIASLVKDTCPQPSRAIADPPHQVWMRTATNSLRYKGTHSYTIYGLLRYLWWKLCFAVGRLFFVAADSCMISLHIFRSTDPTCAFLAIDVFVQFRASFNLEGCDSAFTITYIAIVIYRILCILLLQFCIDYLLV